MTVWIVFRHINVKIVSYYIIRRVYINLWRRNVWPAHTCWNPWKNGRKPINEQCSFACKHHEQCPYDVHIGIRKKSDIIRKTIISKSWRAVSHRGDVSRASAITLRLIKKKKNTNNINKYTDDHNDRRE